VKKILTLILTLACFTAFAGELKFAPGFSKTQFRDLVKEIGLAATPTPNNPAEPLKTLGFDIALETSITSIDDSSAHWKGSWNDADSLVMVNRVHIQKGLPFGVDLGFSVGKGANLTFNTATLEAKYALLKGSAVTPAITVKAAYTKVFGMDDLDMSTLLAGAYISKGILMFTPYGGIESVFVMAEESSSSIDLSSENVNVIRALAGLQFSPLPLVALNAELAASEDVYQLGLKAGIRF